MLSLKNALVSHRLRGQEEEGLGEVFQSFHLHCQSGQEYLLAEIQAEAGIHPNKTQPAEGF